jgi:hypothetical protein
MIKPKNQPAQKAVGIVKSLQTLAQDYRIGLEFTEGLETIDDMPARVIEQDLIEFGY